MNILLVGDDSENLLTVRKILADASQNVVAVPSPAEALRAISTEQFALILLSLQISGVEGFEAAKLIRLNEGSADTPIIFLSAQQLDHAQVEQGYLLGAVDFLVMPFPPIVLQGKVAAFAKLVSDKHQAAHEADQLRRLVEGTKEYAIFMLDPQGRVATWNSGAERIKQYRAEEIIGQHFSKFYTQEAIDRHWPEYELEVARGEGRFEDEGWRVRKDGTQFWANVVITALHDEAGNLRGFSKITRDMTERKQAEENARRLLQEAAARRVAEENDHRKDEFLATLAHELRNPLAPIRNALQILKMRQVDEETARQTREIMERQVHILVRLVDDLLDVSRVMQGKIELRKEVIELASVVARAVEIAQPLIEAQGHELTVDLPDESLPIEVDPVRLAQVLGNLLTNAAKYTEPNGRILLSAEPAGGQVNVRIRDTGIGIASDMLPHVFELFVQAEHGSAKAHDGLGIGLTLVKHLVEMHGGSVAALSGGLGKGSEFVVRLPLSMTQQKGSLDARQSWRQAHRSSGHRLLVVEDNIDAANSLAMLLRLQGHEVRMAHDGPAALVVAETYHPDMIFLDLGMPGMDGYEVARRIRKLPGLEHVVLAALTGWGQPEDRRRTTAAGFDHHLVKPPEPKVLEELVAELKPAKG